ncbi:MAG TPA: class I tRNA ligase family protein [Phycisphaerae bacterium]|nr:class I tRNA ligase family protein [Phycisphaerae bacterium]
MTDELPTTYDPKAVEPEVHRRWTDAGAFNAEPGDERPKFCIVIPPPNVTDKLHVGHALNNALQDVLIRWRRMQQRSTLWMPGTDHAGIATQTVVEKRILSEEGKRRTDFERDEFVARIQAWKDEYEATIIQQLQLMGCSCDWRRTRFTMDEVCAKAVRAAFFKLFSDGLIYRGKRLVNWDPATQTVLADDEVEHEEVHGHFWYMQYPLVEPVAVGSMGVPPMSTTDVSSVDDSSIDKRHGAHLPHWTRQGCTYHVVFRLADSAPASVLERWIAERQEIVERAKRQGRGLTYQERKELHRLYSERVSSLLDAGRGECLLKDPRVAESVAATLKHFDGQRYDLIAWAVMPNHVHVIVAPLGDHELPKILHSWKSYSAKEADRILGREGQFWQVEYYDHLIRDEEEFAAEVSYVLQNPAKAGLSDWQWVGCRTHGQDARATHGQDGRATHGRDAHATITYVTVATTRPETMLGDTAVAINPRDPRAKALVGRKVRLPIVGREIPIIADEHVVLPAAGTAGVPPAESEGATGETPVVPDEKARFSTGFVKITPAHDPDDYAIGQRHDLPVINVLAPDGTISHEHGWTDWDEIKNPDVEALIGMDRFEAREAVVEFFRQENLLEDVREYTHQVGHSYRSHVPIEPYLSDQWYVAVKQPISNFRFPISDWVREHPDLVEDKDGITYLKDTDVPVNSLAGLALVPLLDGRLRFIPERYAKTYQSWLENLRDWPISRQLWWGHRIPVWSCDAPIAADVEPVPVEGHECDARTIATLDRAIGGDFDELLRHLAVRYQLQVDSHPEDAGKLRFFLCLDHDEPAAMRLLDKAEWQRDTDVLDTWFSSALWPFSTLGWPDESRPKGDPAEPNWAEMRTFYPGDVLCTAREIITLWVSRMVMMGQYCLGDIPFSDVFIHAMIQDGEGRKMSKSLGNGIDPLDIIDSHGADAMRFTLISMTTQTQDVRMPVVQMTLPDGRQANSSPKFDIGRNFCNKLWNASRFAMMNLRGCPAWADIRVGGNLADRWILSRLNVTIRDAVRAMEAYRFNELADTLYHFMWDDFCDWYLEIAKGRINAGEPAPKAVLAHCLDVLLRLLHPIMPFITEAIWRKLNELVPHRGPGDQPAEPLLIRAQWPMADARMIDAEAERRFEIIRDVSRGIRNIRTEHNVPTSKVVSVSVPLAGDAAPIVEENKELIESQARAEVVTQAGDWVPPADAAVFSAGGTNLYVHDVIDRDAELKRLAKQRDTLARGVAGIEAKLGNEKFLAKAPPEVVQGERDRLAALKTDLAAVERSLNALKS